MEQPHPARGDDSGEGEPVERWDLRTVERHAAPGWMRPMLWAEDALQFSVAAVLVAVAGVVLVHAVTESFRHGRTFATAIPDLINTVLFVVIVLELFGTVVSHFRAGGFQLRPFLIIGIVSGVRHILSVGAQSTFGGNAAEETGGSTFAHTMIEFGVNVGIVLGLVLALVLVTRFHADASD